MKKILLFISICFLKMGTILAQPCESFAIRANVNNATICAGETATLRAWGDESYIWSNGATTDSITVSPTVTTSYTATTTNPYCDPVYAVGTVYVKPSINNVRFNIITICSGSSATLIGSGATTYSWSNGATTRKIIVTPTRTKTYSVTGTKNGCTSKPFTGTVTVNPIPKVRVNSITICSGNSALLIASGGTAYSWSNGATTRKISINPGASATYSVTGSKDGCVSSAFANVLVNNCSKNGLFNEYELNENDASLMDIKNPNSEIQTTLSVYPNPNNGSFTVQSLTGGNYSIITELGETVQQFNLNTTSTVSIENLSNGIYFIVGYNNSQVTRQKIVVIK